MKLHLDVTRALDVPLEVHRPVTECGGGLALRGRYGLIELRWIIDATHATAAAAGRSFDKQRPTDAFRLGASSFHAGRAGDVDRLERARHNGNAGIGCAPTRGQLVAE